MESPFGSRLFRLFLLFALIPSLLLILLGYYLAVQPGLNDTDATRDIVPALNDYYSARLDSATVATLAVQIDTILPPNLDFLLVFVGDSLRYSSFPPDSLAGVQSQLVRCIDANRHSGGVTVGDRLYQFAGYSRGDSLFVGGIAHTPGLSHILMAYQQTHAAAATEKGLRTRYAVFLALVFGVVALVALGLAYALSRRLARHLSQPLTQLSEATGRIAAGEYGQTVPPQGVGEIRNLIENFNRMTGQLQSTTARLVQTERIAAWREVARRFAHELKNPLQPIAVSLYQIRQKLTGTPAYDSVAEPLEAVTEEVRHLTDLAQRFSNLAKMPEAKLERHDLTAVISSIIELYREKMAPYEFCTETPVHPVMVRLDITYFREAIHNLLQNSVDATPPGKRISLRLYTDYSSAFIEVADEGEGMTDHMIDSLPIAYFSTKPHGTGLGMTIVHQAVAEHRGSIMTASSKKAGTTITIRLPLDKGAADA